MIITVLCAEDRGMVVTFEKKFYYMHMGDWPFPCERKANYHDVVLILL